jgi:hypothetical protein
MDTERTRRMAAALLRDGEAGVSAVVDAVVLAWTQIYRETHTPVPLGGQIRTPRPPLRHMTACPNPVRIP